jgi:hypothetical protein
MKDFTLYFCAWLALSVLLTAILFGLWAFAIWGFPGWGQLRFTAAIGALWGLSAWVKTAMKKEKGGEG